MADQKTPQKSKLPLIVSAGIVAVLVLAYFFIPSVNNFLTEAWDVLTSDDKARIEAWVENFGWVGPFVLILTMVLQMFLLVIPTILLMVAAILAYGPLWGSLLILVAVYAASSVGYVLGSYFGQFFTDRILGRKTEKKIEVFVEDYGFWAVAITRFNPFLSNDAISFVAGVLKMGYWKFIGATLVGIVPLTVYIAFIGQSIDQLKSGLLWGSLTSLIVFGAYLYWDKKIRKES